MTTASMRDDSDAASQADQASLARVFAAGIGFILLAVIGYVAAWTALSELQIAVIRVTTALSVIGVAACALVFAPVAAINTAAAKLALFGGALATGAISYATYPVAPLATGTSKARHQFYVEGVMITRTGCEGAMYSAAPKPGASTNTAQQIWLADGVLSSAAGVDRAATYTGTLRTDGSFALRTIEPSSAGERGRLAGRINTDGSFTVATWDSVFMSGCVTHYKGFGSLGGGAKLSDLLRTER